MRRAVDDLVNERGNPNGTNQHGYNNIIPTEQQGTSREYTLRRLKRDAPELAEMVIAGELSANAATIAAGIHTRATPLDQRRKAWGKATADERARFDMSNCLRSPPAARRWWSV